MTTDCPPDRPSSDADPAIVLGPGNAAAFDGDRWHLPVVVRLVDSPAMWLRSDPNDAAAVIADVVEARDVRAIRLRDLDVLGEYFSEFSVDEAVATLRRVAREADVPLVVDRADCRLERSESV